MLPENGGWTALQPSGRARDALCMNPHPPSTESLAESEHSSGAFDWTLAMWVVASFLGGLLATHYVLATVLPAG